ncbi:MAG: hydroxyacid dehydrogenase [Bacteroidales bacterium]|nr:hydroxyacid dehydrogenase [Bacteroidales bacterium]
MKIVFLEPLGLSVERIENECRALKQMGHEVVIYPDRCPEKNIERACDADIVVESNMPLRKDFLDACPNLKMLSIAFTGLDHIDLKECERRGIVVNNAAGYSTEAVAEEAICMMIGLYRHIIENDKITRSCKGASIAPGREISCKTVGVVGLGAIGQRVAMLAKAFGCNVIAWNRTYKEVDGVTLVDKETLLKESDIITLHIALNDETRNFITAKELEIMKPSAIIVNAARGPIINTGDLAEALKNGKISGAALDVFDTEPPLEGNNPLLNLTNTMLLPHIGFATEEAFQLRLGIVVENVARFVGEKQ